MEKIISKFNGIKLLVQVVAIRFTIKMFGISWAEFFVILLVGVLVIPARMWPDVARALARAVSFIRQFIWKISDASERIKQQIDLEKPIDDLIKTTTDEVLADFSTPIKKLKGNEKKLKNKNPDKKRKRGVTK